MSGLRRDEAAVSEIVGALMLIVIVATAASATALFVQAKQRDTQEQQRLELDRRLERLEVLSVRPTLAAGSDPAEWQELNFTVGNLHTKPTVVPRVTLNGLALQGYDLVRFNRTSSLWESEAVAYTDTVVIEPREHFRIVIALPGNLFAAEPVLTTDPVELLLETGRLNHFARVFLPPTAVPLLDVVAVFNGTGYENHAVLDGSRSDHPDDGARIVRWNWTVDDGAGATNYEGRVVRAFECDGVSRDVNLTVTDNFGMMGVARLEGHVC